MNLHLVAPPIAGSCGAAPARQPGQEVLLVPVDGSPGAACAVAHAMEVATKGRPAHIHVLNVQPEIMVGDVGPHITAEAVRAWRMRAAEEALRDAKVLLDANRVEYSAHVAFGEPAAEIVQHAARHGCAAIVMGTRGRGALANLVLGSVAASVVRLATVPVTLVKPNDVTRARSRERDIFDSAYDQARRTELPAASRGGWSCA